MSSNQFVAGMWGTTNLSLMLINATSDYDCIVDVREGPGASRIPDKNFVRVLEDIAKDWLDFTGDNPVILAGMVGSTIGWKNVGYTNIAEAHEGFIDSETFVASLNGKERSVHIIKGLCCREDAFGADVMRGEEIEIFGALMLFPELTVGSHLICIPGTHAKWVLLVNGRIANFFTSVAGEIFAGIKANGVLIPTDMRLPAEPSANFLEGIDKVRKDNQSLMHQLFDVRARQVLDGETPQDAAERLSGLIIGSDVFNALKRVKFQRNSDMTVMVIGSDALSSRYVAALAQNGAKAVRLPAIKASSVGLQSVFMSLS